MASVRKASNNCPSLNIGDALSSLQSMGYSDLYISRAIKVHRKSKKGTNYNLSLLVEIISRLEKKDKQHQQNQVSMLLSPRSTPQSPSPPSSEQLTTTKFKAHFNSMEALKLKPGDIVDYRFENGRYVLCKILQKTINIHKHYVILLHPLSISDKITKHNRLCDLNIAYHKLAAPKSVSLRILNNKQHPLYSLQIDDFVVINPIYRKGHEGWKCGRIIKFDPTSSQIKVIYYNMRSNTNQTYWFHLENENEVAISKKQMPEIYTNKCTQLHKASSISCDTSLSLSNFEVAKVDVLDTIKIPDIPPSPEKKYDDNKEQKEHKEEIISRHFMEQTPSPPIPTPKYSMGSSHSGDFPGFPSINSYQTEFMNHSFANHGNMAFKFPNVSRVCSFENQITPQQSYNNETDEIVQQLLTFGYDRKSIMMALKAVNNPLNINEVIEYIESHDMNIFIKETSKRMSQSNWSISEIFEQGLEDDDEDSEELFTPKPGPITRKPTPRPPPRKSKPSCSVFGVDPISLESTIIWSKDYDVPIPNVLIKLKEDLFKYDGHLMEKIFREKPDLEELEKRVDIINHNNGDDDKQCNEGGDVVCKEEGKIMAELIKMWFNKLPKGILSDIDVEKLENCKNLKIAGDIICNEMGEPYESYYKWLLDLCIDITKYEKQNKMSIKKLAAEIAPILCNYDLSKAVNVVKFVELSIQWRGYQK